jgi:hypothetical protein
MKKIVLTTLNVFLILTSQAQNFDWANSIGGNGYDYGESVVVDANGNVYAIGGFGGTIDSDPGTATVNLISNGSDDFFIQKLDASGNLVWAKSIGGSGSDGAFYITIDAAGNLLITGLFSGTTDFDPSGSTSNLTSNGMEDLFILKLDLNGAFIWVVSAGGTSIDQGSELITDANNNVYITGQYEGTVDFDPGASTNNLTSNGSQDVFILKLNSSGNFVWAKSVGGASLDQGHSITIDASGNSYTTGVFSGAVDFDPGTSTNNLISNSSSSDAFILKLDASGNFVWANAKGAANYESSNSIALDGSANIYTTGLYDGTVDFDPGSGVFNLTSSANGGAFVQKLDANGNFIWAKALGECDSECLAVDGSGNVYTSGSYVGTNDFDPSASTSNLTSNGSEDIFIQKLDDSGNFIWAVSIGGTGEDDYPEDIYVDASNNIYTTGSYESTVDFDPGSSTNNLTSNGASDVFLQKLNEFPSSILEMESFMNINVYPNPTKGLFTISLDELTNNTSIIIYSVVGKEVVNQQIITNQTTINLKDYDKGIYFVKIQNGVNIITKRIVKQ